MTIILQKFRQSLNTSEKTAFVIFFLYGIALFIFLFNTVHDRSDEEFKKRLVPRYNNVIMTWINHGYFAHGGLAFRKPASEDPKQSVWKSITMGYLQMAHLIQRINVALTGEFSPRLMALHNQLFLMLSSALLGCLAMRLSQEMGLPTVHSLVLGLSAQTVFQTFPMSLGAIWENYQQDVWQVLVILFLLRENKLNWRGYEGKNKIYWRFIVFLMFYIDPYVTTFFMASYCLILLTTMPENFNSQIIKSILLSGGCAVLIMGIQVNWVRFNYPQIFLDGSSLLYRSGLDGDIQYYSNHWDLLFTQYAPWLPRWKTLLLSGALATIAVVCLTQWKQKHLNHQTILFMSVSSFVPMAFFFSQNGVIHPLCYEHFLAMPMILALFTLLPAWLETFNRHSGVFVLFAGLGAFSFAGLQMLAYWIHMPPYL